MKKLVVMALIALTAGVVASVALATHSRYTANGVVPMFCGAPIPRSVRKR